mmetsp:Transcript_14931/g.24854  ORF Transcript_14931/g.24854 Transcript_14931/m.24854 type:complete len:321 (-) Transcript_14931:161-1123(-)
MKFIFLLLVLSGIVPVDAFSFLGSALLPLRTEVEIALDFDANFQFPQEIAASEWFKEVTEQRKANAGPEAVSSAVSAMQKLAAEDRDITCDDRALKYYDFLSTCLRSEGSSWTATLGSLESMGIRLTDHVDDVFIGQQTFRKIDTISLCRSIGNCIGLDLAQSESVASTAKMNSDQVRNLLDLSLVITRLAIRYAIVKEQFEKHEAEPPSEVDEEEVPEAVKRAQQLTKPAIEAFDNLEIVTLESLDSGTSTIDEGDALITAETLKSFKEIVVPGANRFGTLLEYDFNVPEEDLPIKGSSRVIIHRSALEEWWKANKLTK